MATELTTHDEADGRRALAWKASSLLFSSTTDQFLAEFGDNAGAALAAIEERTALELAPVPNAGAQRKQWEAALDERLRRLAAKVLPTAGEAAAEWRASVVEALSDLPAMIALTAAKRAIHKPYRFVGEIEHEIRAIAAGMIMRRRTRLAMVARRRAELAGAVNPALPAPTVALTAEAIRALQPWLRDLGVSVGVISREAFEQAMAELPDVAGHSADYARDGNHGSIYVPQVEVEAR